MSCVPAMLQWMVNWVGFAGVLRVDPHRHLLVFLKAENRLPVHSDITHDRV